MALAIAALMSTVGMLPFRPKAAYPVASWRRRAARANVRTGAGPVLKHVPPRRSASMSVTAAPHSWARIAARSPGGPPPPTMTFMAILFSQVGDHAEHSSRDLDDLLD